MPGSVILPPTVTADVIKIDGVCYQFDETTTDAITHAVSDEEFVDCDACAAGCIECGEDCGATCDDTPLTLEIDISSLSADSDCSCNDTSETDDTTITLSRLFTCPSLTYTGTGAINGTGISVLLIFSVDNCYQVSVTCDPGNEVWNGCKAGTTPDGTYEIACDFAGSGCDNLSILSLDVVIP